MNKTSPNSLIMLCEDYMFAYRAKTRRSSYKTAIRDIHFTNKHTYYVYDDYPRKADTLTSHTLISDYIQTYLTKIAWDIHHG